MKFIFGVMLIAAFSLTARAQTAVRTTEADEIKKAVEMIAADKKPKAEIVLRDLIEIEGKILRVDDDSFVLEPKEKNDRLSIRIKVISIGNYPKKRVNIKYTDVLQIVGKQATRSFVPDPKLTSYSEWNSLASIGVGALLQVHTMDGKKYTVFLQPGLTTE
jgi:hypothetical protein